jgi:hypothetical protein
MIASDAVSDRVYKSVRRPVPFLANPSLAAKVIDLSLID